MVGLWTYGMVDLEMQIGLGQSMAIEPSLYVGWAIVSMGLAELGSQICDHI